MKAKVFFAGLLFAVIFFYSLSYSQVPQMINYQGKLTTPQGALIDTTVSMVFSIYADSEGTILLWEEEQTSMVVEKGIFDVLLGALNPLDDTVFEGGVRYLGVKVGDDPEMIPLKEMVSVAYAFRSEWADSTEFCYIESIYVHFIESDGDWDFSGDNIYRLIGNVGIGTDNPQEKLHVVGNAIMEGAEGKGNVWYTLKSNLGGNAGINLTSAGAGVNNWQIWRNGTSEDFQITETMPYPPGSIDAFIIKTDGDVGVGTTGPMAQLHVISDLMGETAVLGDGYVGVSGTGGWAGVVGSGALWGGYFDGDGYFSGKVGIGTTNPEVELHLSNNSPSDPNTTIRLHDFGVTFNKTVDLTVIAADMLGDFSGLKVNNNIWGTENLFTTERVYAGMDGTGMLPGAGNKLIVKGSATIGTNYYEYDAPPSGLIVEGNVGIGTASPTEKLDVEGNIHASGTITSGSSVISDGINNQIRTDGNTLCFGHEPATSFEDVTVGIATQNPFTQYALHVEGKDEGIYAVATQGSNTYRPFAVNAALSTTNSATTGGGFVTSINKGTDALNIDWLMGGAFYMDRGGAPPGDHILGVTAGIQGATANDWGVHIKVPSPGYAIYSEQNGKIYFAGDVGIGTTNPGGGTGNSILSLANTSANPTAVTGVTHLYSSGGEGWWMDDQGNATQQTPHDPKTGEWIFYSKNIKTGRVVRVNMEKLVKAVERLTGEKFMIETWEERN